MYLRIYIIRKALLGFSFEYEAFLFSQLSFVIIKIIFYMISLKFPGKGNGRMLKEQVVTFLNLKKILTNVSYTFKNHLLGNIF